MADTGVSVCRRVEAKAPKVTIHNTCYCVTAWACMAANGTRSLVFTDDVTADRSSRMNSDVCRATPSAQIQPNVVKPIGRPFRVQMDYDPKHTVEATQEFLTKKQ